MHDIWFASKIIVLLNEKVDREKSPKRIVVNVLLSPLCHVTSESLRAAFGMLSGKDALLRVAELNIARDKVTVECRKCCERFDIDGPEAVCQKCGYSDFDIVNNEEFLIQSIEIEYPAPGQR